MINKVSLAEAIRAIGKADVFAGDPSTAGGLIALGATEGEITVEELESYNDLTAPEYTGEGVHERDVIQEGAIVRIPLVRGAAELYDKASSIGDGSGGGHSEPQAAVPTTILVIPRSEIGDGLSYPAAGPWDPAAPVHAVWLWRAVPEAGSFGFQYEDKGKRVEELAFRTLYDSTRPEGHKFWTRGDPIAAGMTVEV